MTALFLAFNFPIEFLYGGAQIFARKGVMAADVNGGLARLLRKERNMSLVTHLNSGTRKAGVSRLQKFTSTTFVGGSRSALAAFGRYLVRVFDAIGEARVHRAMIEVELYRGHYLHSSKNDDDLPIIR